MPELECFLPHDSEWLPLAVVLWMRLRQIWTPWVSYQRTLGLLKLCRATKEMLPPGWNVTEPLSLVAILYRVVESLKAAPEDAKLFTAQIEEFGRLLRKLQRIVDESLALDPGEDHEDLRITLANCQLCVERCQKFQESFQKLSNADSTRMANAGQVALWVWNDRKIVRLRQEIDSQMKFINSTLLCKI